MKVTINVSADDIAHGRIGECHFCPLARAMNRALPAIDYLHSWAIDGLHAYLGDKIDVSVALPDSCFTFVERYDAGCRVYPFTFEVTLPANAAEFVKVPA